MRGSALAVKRLKHKMDRFTDQAFTEISAPSFRQSFLAMLGICLVIILVALDQTVVGTALPRIVAELQGFAWYAWVATAYLLTSAIAVPVVGRLGDLYGRKYFVLTGIALFTLASAACGGAQSMWQLVVARGAQGIGGGMLVGAAFASVADLFPDMRRRLRWQVMISSSFGVASALGPLLGGLLTQHWGWRSVFFVNLPVGMIAIAIVYRYLPRYPGHRQSHERFDWVGVAWLSLALCILLITSESGAELGYLSFAFWGLLGLGLASLWVFWRFQLRSASPLLPPRLFESANVRRLALLSLMTGVSMFSLIFYVPLLLQGGFGYSPHAAGIAVTPLVVCITVGSIINGRLLARFNVGSWPMVGGMIGLAVACVVVSLLRADVPLGWVMLIFGFCGFTLGFQLPNLTLHMQSCVEKRDLGMGSALVQTLRMFGSMFGASVGGVIVLHGYVQAVEAVLPASTGAAGHAVATNPQLLMRQADQQQLAQIFSNNGVSADMMAMLLKVAHVGLTHSIQSAIGACAVVALISAWVARKLPPMKTHST